MGTLEEELLKQDFKSIGPIGEFELPGEVRLLYSENIKPVHVQIIPEKIARGNRNNYLGYMIYFK